MNELFWRSLCLVLCLILYRSICVLYLSILYLKSSNSYVTRRTFVVFFTIRVRISQLDGCCQRLRV